MGWVDHQHQTNYPAIGFYNLSKQVYSFVIIRTIMEKKSGTYHKFNCLKFRLLEAAINSNTDIITCHDLARATGLPYGNISRAMSHYALNKFGYFKRLPNKTPTGGYRYTVTKHGAVTYMNYLRRVKIGFSLNCFDKVPNHMSTYRGLRKLTLKTEEDRHVTPDEIAPYIGLSKYGVEEIGLSEDDKLSIVGILPKQNHTEFCSF